MNIFKNKFILTVIAIVVVGGLAYLYLSSQTAPATGDLVVSSSNGDVVGSDILSSLAAISSITLNPQIFTNINTLQLVDFSQDLPDNVPTGRENPFEPQNFVKSTTNVLPGGPQKFATTTKAATAPKAIPSTTNSASN